MYLCFCGQKSFSTKTKAKERRNEKNENKINIRGEKLIFCSLVFFSNQEQIKKKLKFIQSKKIDVFLFII
jgi:hypothetical protein